MTSPAQIQANRANAQLSSGPLTPETKAISSMNGLKTGLTGQTILLPGDDLDAYKQHIARLRDEYEPATDREKTLVQSIADTDWRLLRIPTLEAGIYALGTVEYAGLFTEQPDPATRAAMIRLHTFKNNRKDLSNIHLQEMRLRRHRQNDLDELTRIQHDRQFLDRDLLERAQEAFSDAKDAKQPFDHKEFGFEFSQEFLEARHSFLLRKGKIELPAFDRAWKLSRSKKPA